MRATLWARNSDLSTYMDAYSTYLDVGGCTCLLAVRRTCHELADGQAGRAEVQTRHDTTRP